MKKIRLVLLLLVFLQSNAQILVSPNQRFLQTADGQPFFWLADTNWEMIHRLKVEEIEELMETRKNQGFNILQVVALAEFDGLKSPNRYGDLPLVDLNPTQLNQTAGSNIENAQEFDYWDLLDKAFDIAEQKGLYIGLLPTWGDKVAHMWGDGPIVFNQDNAKSYGRILAKRYGNRKNIIWILGGDRPAKYKWNEIEYDDTKIWRSMAEGIKEGEDIINTQHKFMTYHPAGGENRTSNQIHNEKWLDMNAFQSGHGARETKSWNWTADDLKASPTKPTLDMEPCYEDHPMNPWSGNWTRKVGYFKDLDVRNRIYRNVFAGACGTTYGHHHIWQFTNKTLNPPINVGDTVIPWQTAMNAKAASEMQFLKKLMTSRPYFSRISDQSMLAFEQDDDYKTYIAATRDQNGTYAMVYFPNSQSRTFELNLDKIKAKKITLTWFNPQTGFSIKRKPIKKPLTIKVSPPQNMQDAVLIIDDASKKYLIP